MGWGVSRTHEVLVMVDVTNHWTKVLILLTEDFVTQGMVYANKSLNSLINKFLNLYLLKFYKNDLLYKI